MMFFGLTSPWTSALPGRRRAVGERVEPARELGMAAAGGAEIGLEAERLEEGAGRKHRGDRLVAAVAAWIAARLAPTRRQSRDRPAPPCSSVFHRR